MWANTSKESLRNAGESIHSNLMRESKDDVFKKYEIVEMLGQGSMGYVSKVRVRSRMFGSSQRDRPIPNISSRFGRKRNATPLPALPKKPSDDSPAYAMKMIQRDRVAEFFHHDIENEISILKSMDHPNIVSASEVYVYKNKVFIIMEACLGSNLYSFSPYSERQAASITSQLLSAIKYMHDRNIVHRDLKFENILFIQDTPESPIKLIDFGLSKKLKYASELMMERVGSIYTMSPEVLKGIYTSQADMWSIGVIAFMLLSASKPFHSENQVDRAKMLHSIHKGDYNFNAPVWDGISEEAKQFVKSLIVVDPYTRPTAKGALKHPWIAKREKLSNEIPTEASLMNAKESLLHFRHAGLLKRLALNVIACQSSFNEITQLSKIFQSYDTDHDGVINYEEFQAAFKGSHYTREVLREIFHSVDVSKNGYIEYTEFLAATLEASGLIQECRIAEAFDRIDVDHSGYISKRDLRNWLGKKCSKVQLCELIDEADLDGDGRISYPEFLGLFRGQSREKAFCSTTDFDRDSQCSESHDL